MNYLLKYDFSCANKSGKISLKSGECDISSELPLNIKELKEDNQLKSFLIREMARQTKQGIISLDIVEILLVTQIHNS